MGQSSSTDDNDVTDLIKCYTIENKCQQGTLLKHKTTKQTFLLKEISFMDQQQYRKALDKYRNKKNSQPKENLLNLVEVEGRVKTNFCSGTYKVYVIYEFPSITLQQEIQARIKESRFFDEQDLWSIMQSCLSGISQLGQAVMLEPHKIFIMNDGLVKIVDPDAICDGTRFVLSEGVYYAPQRFQNFNRAQRGNSSQKETMFSLGMSLLHSAILQQCFDCYNYDTLKFNSKNLQERVSRLAGLYSQQFIFVINNLLELNANRRSSILELQDVINKFWSKQGETQENQEEQREPTITTVNIEKQQVNLNKVVKQADIHMVNKVTFSEICDVEKSSSKQKEASALKEVNTLKDTTNRMEVRNEKEWRETKEVREVREIREVREVKEVKEHREQEPLKQQPTKPSTSFISTSYIPSTYIPPYVPTYSYLNPVSPSFYYPPPPISVNNQNLFTDPKLLELLRKDLSEINSRRTLSRQNTFQSHLYQQQYHISNIRSPIQGLDSAKMPEIPRSSLLNSQTVSAYPRVEIIKQVYEDGRVYEGPIVNGMKEGQGKLTYPDGAYYDGHFSKNKMHGFGTLYYRINKPAYEGFWHQDQFHGKGILYNENPVEQLDPFDYSDFNLVEDFWIRYQGEFQYDNKHGPGRLLLANGQYFEGQFEKDCIHGTGKFYDKFGQVHSGTWDNNILEHEQQ